MKGAESLGRKAALEAEGYRAEGWGQGMEGGGGGPEAEAGGWG